MSSASVTAPHDTATTHILVFPYPAQGHMLPLLDLTRQLALRGLQVTILVTPKNVPNLGSLLSAHPDSIQTLVLPFPPHPELPLGVENVKDVGSRGTVPIIEALRKLEGGVIEWFQSHPSPPQAILSDFFLGYTNCWANRLNVPRIAFFTSGAFVTCVVNHLLLSMDKLYTTGIIELLDLPRSPCFTEEHLPGIWQKHKDELLENCKSWGCVINTFYALEGEYLDHIKQKQSQGRVYAVGPLSLNSGSKSLRVNLESHVGCGVLNWLDKCPDGSVLYVCFGSQKLLSQPHMEALALGLQRSKVRFLWVVKSATSQELVEDHKWDPTEFKEQGIVVKGWAPQVEILNHKAVGGFLSHCGWNSLLESIMAGVMVLAWPMEGDQFINARLVEDMGLAVQLCEGENTVPDPDKLASTISESVAGNIPQKDRAKWMREKAFEAVTADGSSSKDLDELVRELRQIEA